MLPNNISVSAIIPFYNGKEYFHRAIQSLLNQSYALNEILIINDNSDQENLFFLKQYSSQDVRIKVYSNPENIGSSNSRNKGIELSSSEYVLLMDQDDILETNALERFIIKLFKMRQKFPGNDWVGAHSAYKLIDEKDNIIGLVDDWQQVKADEFLGYQFIRNRIITNSGVLIEKKYLARVGYYDPKLRYSQDWDLWLKLGAIGAFAYLDETFTSVRRHHKNTSAKIQGFQENTKRILKKFDLDYIKKAIFRRSLSREENLSDYYSILVKIEDWDCLQSEIQILSESSNNHPDVLFYNSILCYKQLDFKRALKHLEKIPIESDYYLSSINNKGVISLLLGKREKAKRYFNKALNLNPTYIDAQKNITLFEKNSIDPKSLHLTKVKLRKTLLKYNE